MGSRLLSHLSGRLVVGRIPVSHLNGKLWNLLIGRFQGIVRVGVNTSIHPTICREGWVLSRLNGGLITSATSRSHHNGRLCNRSKDFRNVILLVFVIVVGPAC
ncbi:hypothetical protein ABW21_db0200205 [Orbilia brochopaga]|nr:hypothetical protein ABW21_db0200205 [Drechslerella brochopaga]